MPVAFRPVSVILFQWSGFLVYSRNIDLLSSSVETDGSLSSADMRSLATSIALLVLTSACTVSVGESDGTTTTLEAPTTSTSTETPAEIDPVPDELASPCRQGDHPFSTSGVISAFGGAGGDAAQVSGIRTGLYPGCERVVIDLLTADGAPAGSVGLVGVEYDDAAGVVRINLPPTIRRTAVADLRLDGELVNRAFVVQTRAGPLALDIHAVAGTAVALRAFEVTEPSRIVVDFQRDPVAPIAVGAATGPDIVVTTPIAGSGGVPLVVTGYGREQLVEARLHEDRAGEPLAIVTADTARSTEAWREFSLTFEDPPRGTAELYVGTDQTGLWLSIDNGPTRVLGDDDA